MTSRTRSTTGGDSEAERATPLAGGGRSRKGCVTGPVRAGALRANVRRC
jgi:hypothetical protein